MTRRLLVRRLSLLVFASLLGLLAGDPQPAEGAPEICGNGADEDGDGYLDEGCNPEGSLHVRETPLPASAVGIVSPLKGQQVWTEPADFDIEVAYGPRLRFERQYRSQVSQTGQARGPLGTGWSHNYLTWVDSDASLTWANVRLATGDEVGFTWDGTLGAFKAQPGYHVKSLTTNGAGTWTLTTLEGWSYTYSGAVGSPAYLNFITDPRGQSLTITRTGGRIDKVAAAVGAKELRFTYASQSPNQLTSVAYYADNVLRSTLTLPNNTKPLTAKYGSTTFRNYLYDATTNKLIKVSDASSHTVVEFGYASGTAGKTVGVKSGAGFVSYGYPAADPTCVGGTYLYYNAKDNPSGEGVTCTTDTDCDTACGGPVCYCGGVVGGATSGVCFRARRCVAVTTNPSEDCVCAVTSSCPTCTDTLDRIWDTSALLVNGKKDAQNVEATYLHSSNGLVTRVVENDSDGDHNANTIPAGARATYFFYGNATYPGLVTEVRRKSEIGSGTCDDGVNTAGCKRTLYTYTTGGQVDTIQEIGFTYGSAGAVTSYSYTTDYDYDVQGRVTQVNGPRTDTSYDIVQYTYWSGAGNLKEGYLKEVKRQTGASTFVTTTYNDYDYWGNAIQITDPNSNLTCLTFDANRNVLTTERVAMANQTSCTANAADLVTTYTYDSALNVTKVQKPEGNCNHYEYDTRGRLSKLKSRDDCNAASTGDTQEFTYDDAGNLIKTEHKDSTGAVTYRQEKTYGADGRVLEIINPAAVTKKKTLAYKSDGMLESITGEDAVGKTEWAYDNLNRTDAEKRYNSGSTFDTWDLTPGVQLDLPTKVQDDDTKHIDWVWDDMGRKVKQITPDAGTSIFVYDAAGNLTDHRQAKDSPDEKLHQFSYDPLNRPLQENWGDPACFTLGGSEIQYFYDDVSSCPIGTCVNSLGRLAKVRTKIHCDDAQPDDTFDQLSYFGYDDAGRIVQESIRDDATRVADQYYTWDKNGNSTKTTAPSSYYQKSVYGTTGAGSNNSDKDKLVEIDRGNGGTDTVLIDGGKWYPFGPIKEYRQSNTISGNKIIARLTWDLAHRPSNILYEQETSGTDLFRIAYTLDAQGRVTTRDFTGADPGVQDAYYTYDWQSRITCDSAASGTCPTSGSNLKSNFNSSPPYTASSDRRSLIHASNGWNTDTFTHTYVTGRDQIDYVTKSDTQTIDFAWDGRGNRTYDDDAEFADDRRDYVYDARDNVISVSGKMKISDTVVHNYTMTNAFDHKNRRIFKSLLDTTAAPNVESQYFYYYDTRDRLIEVKYTPNITDTSTYQVWQFYWIDNRPVLYHQTTYPAGTVARRFVHSDELGTPLESYTWPMPSGDAGRAWAVNPDAFGWHTIVNAIDFYQPLRFPGQMSDDETAAVYFNSVTSTYAKTRPPLSDNRYRVYDAFTGGYLQADPRVASSWNAYAYAGNNGVMHSDRTGLLMASEGHVNKCSASQLEGGWSEVDGECILTCWNCPGSVGGGTDWPDDCTTGICEGSGPGEGGGGTPSPIPPEPEFPHGKAHYMCRNKFYTARDACRKCNYELQPGSINPIPRAMSDSGPQDSYTSFHSQILSAETETGLPPHPPPQLTCAPGSAGLTACQELTEEYNTCLVWWDGYF